VSRRPSSAGPALGLLVAPLWASTPVHVMAPNHSLCQGRRHNRRANRPSVAAPGHGDGTLSTAEPADDGDRAAESPDVTVRLTGRPPTVDDRRMVRRRRPTSLPGRRRREADAADHHHRSEARPSTNEGNAVRCVVQLADRGANISPSATRVNVAYEGCHRYPSAN
jgi:hypothetical protein